MRLGLLVFLLVAPVLVLFFLYFFNENHYDVPIYYKNGVHGETPGEAHQVASFTLANQKGEQYTFDPQGEQVYVVNFFFTTCGSFCPKVTNNLLRVQDRFSAKQDVRILSLSVDPKTDQPKVLSDYAERYGIQSSQWQLLTGKKDKIYDIILNEFLLPIEEDGSESHSFLHSDKIVLVDGQGRIRGYYGGQEDEEVDRLLAETKVVLNQMN